MDERMTGGELWTVRTGLGLPRSALGRRLGVREDTVKAWEIGKERIPVRVRGEVEALEAYTAGAVGDLVDALNAARDVAVEVYRSDADMPADRADVRQLGASWWRMVVFRAALEVPGVEIGTRAELDARAEDGECGD